MSFREKIAGFLSLPAEIALNLPLAILTGRGELNVENYKGIREYTETKVTINTSSGMLAVEGKKLSIKQVTSENIVVTGRIDSLLYTD